MSTSLFLGALCFSAALYGQLLQPPDVSLSGESRPRSELAHFRDADELEPDIQAIVPEVPEHTATEPISGVVSVHELQHPIKEKALLAAFEAQQLSSAHKIGQAIAKLEKAVRIDPHYRDGHWNLGVQYARVGRMAEAHVQFQKALEIGPAAPQLYANLALTLAAMGQFQQAGALAHKALELDPANRGAQLILRPDSP